VFEEGIERPKKYGTMWDELLIKIDQADKFPQLALRYVEGEILDCLNFGCDGLNAGGINMISKKV